MAQQLYVTEVTLRIQLQHYKGIKPEQIVAHLKDLLRSKPMTLVCEQEGELTTIPEWPYDEQDLI